jgi:aryl-alcohol dehydrogenase-like predicted oxidoreductase
MKHPRRKEADPDIFTPERNMVSIGCDYHPGCVRFAVSSPKGSLMHFQEGQAEKGERFGKGENAMEKRSFGNTGMQVGPLGFGAAEIGFEHTDDRTVDTLLGVAQDCGINVIDTAAAYSDSEEKLGRALQGKRNQFFLFTKCGQYLPPRRSLTGLWLCAQRKLRTKGRGDEYESLDWHPSALEWNIEQSLCRLKTDRIDLIQLHSCSEATLQRSEVIEVLQRARQAGKVLHIGYSGDGAAACYAIRCGQFEAVQMSINVADQQALDRAVPLAHQNGMGVIAKRPVANGLWRNKQRPEHSQNHAYWERLRDLRYDFLEIGRDFATALRFTLSITGVHTAIVGTTNPAHLRQNAEFSEAGPLTDSQLDAIRTQWKRTAGPDWVGQR